MHIIKIYNGTRNNTSIVDTCIHRHTHTTRHTCNVVVMSNVRSIKKLKYHVHFKVLSRGKDSEPVF